MNIKMVDKYCGLGNIVKGVKKRKKKSDSSNRHYAFPYDDQLRTNESVHTLLSKLDIVDKKLEKFDQSHPLPTQIQGFRGMMGVNQDNSYPKLQVQLPDNWLELMKNCESRGNRPCLEVTVKSDCNCREELQYGVPCSRRAAYTDSKSGRRTCSCEMARRDALETCYGAKSQRSTVSADQRNGYSTCSCNNHQYVTAESSVPCEESPNTMPFSKVPKRSTPPPRSTGMITKNISQGARGSEECLETAPLASLCGAPSELSESAPSVSSNRNPLSVRPCVAWMEPRCQEIEEEVDYSNNNQSYATRVPKQVEFETDSGDCPDQKSPSTIGSYPSCGQEYSPEQNATSGCSPYRSSPCASRCRELNKSQTDQLVLYPGFGAVSPVSCCQDAARQNDSKTRASSRNENKVVEPSKESNKSGASPNCLCAQAICMIQNCSKHQRRQPSQQRGQYRAGEPASQETSCTLYGNCESQFTTLVVNIPRTPIVTSSPAEHKSGLEERNFGVQNYGLVEFGRLAPIKSCECDIIRDTTGISQSPPRITQSTPPPPDSDNVQSRSSPGKSTQSTNSHKEAGQLEKKCSLSPKRNSQHDNIDSNNQIASPKPKSSHEEQDPGSPQDGKLDSSKDGSPQKPKTLPERQDGRGSHSENTDPSRPSKDGSPQKHKMSPGRQDTRGSHSGNKGPHRPSKDEDSSTNGKADTSLVIQDEVKFEGQGESEIPINEPEKHREIFSASDPSSAPLLLLRRGFVRMHQPFLAPSGSNLNNSTRECDLRSCSVKSAQRDLFIGEGTILTSHPSNISTHKEFHAIDGGVSKSAFSPQSSLNKPSVEEESQIPRGSSEDFKVLTVTQAENYVLPMLPQDESLVTEKPKAAHNKYKDDGFNPQNDPISGKSQLHDYGLSEDIQQHSAFETYNNSPSADYKFHDQYKVEQSEMEKQWYRDKTKPKNTNSEPHEKMDGKEKCCEDSQKRVSDSEKQNYSASVTYKFQDHHKTEQSEGEKQWHRDKTKPKNSNSEPPEKLEEGKAKSSEVRQRHVSDHPEHYREGDLQVPKITSETFIDVPTCKNQSVSVHKRSNREAGRRAKIRGKDKSFSHAEISSRSNSLNSKKTIPRVCDSERQRIHKLARKCIQKHSASRSTVANFSLISPSYCNKDTKNNYKAASLSSTSSQSYNRAPSNLKNQEYLKELIFPFAQQGPRLSEQEESVTQKSIQKFVIERIIRINPCVQDYEEATQFSDLTEDDGEENCAPRSLEAFIGSRPAISGTSTCPTGYAPSTASKPSYIGGALGSRAVSDFVRGTFMRLYGTEEDERSEENFIYHAFPSFDDPTNQSLDVFDDAIAGGRQQSSVERTRKYELMEEYLRDSMLKSLYSELQGEAPPHSWDSARNGFQNQAKTTIFHQDVNRTILAPAKLVASSSTDDNHQDTHCTPSDTPIDETKNPYDAFKELIWNSKFNSSDNTVPATKVDSQLIMALRVKGTRTDRNEVHQESFAGLQKYSEIMDLLEIYPGQRRREDPQEVKTRKWIDKINNFEEEKEQEYYAKNNSTKGRKSKRKDHHNSHDIYRVQQLFRKGNVTSRVNLYKNKRYHIPVQSEQSSSRVSISDSNIEPEVRDKEGQSFLVYMNEGGYLFKERCKHGISNRLPKKPPYWFRGTNHNWLSNVKSELPNDFPDHKLVKDRKHTHRNNYRRHHRHKHRKSSDDSLHDETGLTRKKETIVMKPKKQNISERQYRDVRVPSRSISVSSSSDSSAYEKRVARKPRYSRENDRKITTLTRDNLRYCHRDSLDVANLKKSGKPRSGKNKRISVNSYKQKNYQIKSALKKSKEKSGSSTTVNERETSSTDSSSYTSMPRRKSKDHLPQVRLVKHPNTQTARHVKLSHSPMPIKRVKVKRKAPNAIHNCRHRLITADSKSSASYEKVNVKDFIDLLATLSRNTISTLTNKKKALKLYRNHLYSPRRR